MARSNEPEAESAGTDSVLEALGGHIHLDAWRGRHWAAAVKAGGLAKRPPYALRHTHATFAISARFSLFELARWMGTSVEQIDKTYGHLLPDARERTRIALDRFVSRSRDATEDASRV